MKKKRNVVWITGFVLALAALTLAACGSGGGGGGVGNSAPVASAGPDQNVTTDALVALDGSGSTDADGDTLTYSWSFVSLPTGSTAELSDTTVVNPTFTPDLDGSYVVQLIVNDGTVDSTPDTVTVTAIDPDMYVDAVNGNDFNAGTSAAPFKTITHALSAAGTNKTIQVRPGTYDEGLGETFPLVLQAGQILIGDEANKGNGTTPTIISGQGAAGTTGWKASVIGAEGSRMSGFTIDHAYVVGGFGVYSSDVTMTVSNNIFTNMYGGVILENTGNPVIENNVFDTSSYGVYTHCQGIATIQDNSFTSPGIAVDTNGGAALIRRNTFTAQGSSAIQIAGSPRIENNTFISSGYATYGALRVSSGSPVVRDNTFTLSGGPAVRIDNDGFPDLGTAGEPGGNTFGGTNIETLRIETGGTVAEVYAIGNTWHAETPACGTEIVINNGATVYWGTGASDKCP